MQANTNLLKEWFPNKDEKVLLDALDMCSEVTDAAAFILEMDQEKKPENAGNDHQLVSSDPSTSHDVMLVSADQSNNPAHDLLRYSSDTLPS